MKKSWLNKIKHVRWRGAFFPLIQSSSRATRLTAMVDIPGSASAEGYGPINIGKITNIQMQRETLPPLTGLYGCCKARLWSDDGIKISPFCFRG